jgi:peroxiredoxin Q/BCP
MRSLVLPLLLALGVPGPWLAGCAATTRPDGGAGLLPVGEPAPDLSTTDQNGKAISLRGMAGRRVLVYFYPKDDTPGCTAEACAIRDTWDRFVAADIVVLGVSADDADSHRAFAAEYQLPFALVPDPSLEWAAAFGVGTAGGFTERVSFLIGRDGKIARVYPGVDPAVHAEEVLADAAALP